MIEKMTRQDIIDILCEYYSYTEEDLANHSLQELEGLLLKERKDSGADWYPNGRDFDAEDEDSF